MQRPEQTRGPRATEPLGPERMAPASWARACSVSADDLAIAVILLRQALRAHAKLGGEDSMPAAQKPAAATSAARSRNGTPVAGRAATRRDVERQIARVEKLLGDAGDALQLLGKDMGRGAGDAYKELVQTAKALRRDAQRTNKRMLKDFDKLRSALTPSGATRRSSRKTTATSGTAASGRGAAGTTRSARARSAATSERSTGATRSRGGAGASSSSTTAGATRSRGTRTAPGSKRAPGATRSGRARSNTKPTAG